MIRSARVRSSRLAIAIAVAAAFSAGAALVGSGQPPIGHSVAATTATAVAATPTTPASLVRALPDFTMLVEQYGPAVVNIRVSQQASAGVQGPGVQPGDPFYEFFRRFQPPAPGGESIRQGQGSGFIVSPDGRILTNAHVVANAAEVTVRLADKREFKAKVVGIDRRTDVALIRIDAKDLPSVRIGDPAKVKVGEWVAAIGSPFGLESTVTAGIVSAKSRALPDDSYVPFIQTDVAINPGNSGGPLFNMQGEVIGINSQIYSRTGGYMGLSFSIPIDVAMKVEGDLQKFGRVSRGRLGIGIQPLGAELAESFGLAKPQGALVSSVEPKSAAERAGLKSGDVILSVDGKPIEQTADLPRIVGEAKPGTEITLEVWRERSSRKIRASLGEAPGEALAEVPAAERAPDAARLGIAVRPLTAEEKRRVSLDEGLVVESASGAAARAGIRTGDIILGANSEAIRSTEDLKRAVDKAQGRVALLIQRDGSRIFVPVRTG